MKKSILFLAGAVTLSAISFSFVNRPEAALANDIKKEIVTSNATNTSAEKNNHRAEAGNISAMLYDALQLQQKGLSRNALDLAVRGYLHLQEQGTLKNMNLLSVVDFSQSSRKKRFYLIDMKNSKLLVNTYVAHGKNSGVDMANNFSNIIGSEKSSLGFYVTKGTYTGKNGFSLKMAGLDNGYNDNAEERAIVVHGADYVNESRVNSAYMGRSQGCPALPRAEYIKVIDLIKDSSALFIYSGDASYQDSSTVLNAEG